MTTRFLTQKDELIDAATEAIAKINDGRIHVWPKIRFENKEVDLLLWDEATGPFVLEVVPDEETDQRVRIEASLSRAWSLALFLGSWLSEPSQSQEMTTQLPVATALVSQVSPKDSSANDDHEQLKDKVVTLSDLSSLEDLRKKLSNIAFHPLKGFGRESYQFDSNFFAACRTKFEEAQAKPQHVEQLEAVLVDSKTRMTLLIDRSLEAMKFRLESDKAFPNLEAAASNMRKWRDAVAKPQQLTVAVAGEFKAGKSTLLNALIGEEICFVDDFEATMTITSFASGSERRARVQFDDGREEEWSVETYKSKCAAREMANVDRVEITLGQELPCILMDTPGLGSLTESHTDRAEMAIRQTDAIIVVIDSSHLGSAQTNAFVKRAQEIGFPLILVVSKTENLSDQERLEIIARFKDWFAVPAENVIFTGFDEEGAYYGLEALKARLNQILDSVEETLGRAQHARLQEVELEASKVCDRLSLLLHQDQEWLESRREENQEIAQVKMSALLNDLARQLEDELKQRLLKSNLGESEVEQCLKTFQKQVAPQRIKQFFDTARPHVERSVMNEIDARIQETLERIRRMESHATVDPHDLAQYKQTLENLHRAKEALRSAQQSSGSGIGAFFGIAGIVLSVITFNPLPAILGSVVMIYDYSRRPERSGGSEEEHDLKDEYQGSYSEIGLFFLESRRKGMAMFVCLFGLLHIEGLERV